MPTSSTRAPSFRDAAVSAMTALAAALQDVIDPLEPRVRTPTDLQRALALSAKPAWQVFRVAHAAAPLREACNVPGPGTIATLVRAARRAGVPPAAIGAVESAYAGFLAMVDEHAGDRRTFDSLVSGFTEEAALQLDLQHKRAAFRANSHLWGVQTRARLCCTIIGPADESGDPYSDIATVDAVVGWRRLRLDAPDYVNDVEAGATVSPGASGRPEIRIEPIVGESELVSGVPLLSRYCSKPLPEIRTRREGDIIRTSLVTSGIGNTASISFAFGNVLRNVPGPHIEPGDPFVQCEVSVRNPVEVLVQDVILHEEFLAPTRAEARVFANRCRHDEPLSGPFGPEDELPITERVAGLGRGTAVLRLPEMPRYPDMIAEVFRRLGWDPTRFVALRNRVEYPILHSVVEVIVHLDERGGGVSR